MRNAVLALTMLLVPFAITQARPTDVSRSAGLTMVCVGVPERFLFEGFEASVPPPGWSAVVNNPYTWEQSSQGSYEGTYFASCLYDDTFSGWQDERICFEYTIEAEDVCLCFYAMGSTYWAVDPYQNYDLMVTIDDVAVWSYREDNAGAVTWQWQRYCVDLSAYAVGQTISICLVYCGYNGAQGGFDALSISDCPGGLEPCCPSSNVCYEVDFNDLTGGAATGDCGIGPIPWEWGVPSGIPSTACDGVNVTNVWGTVLDGEYAASTGQALVLGPFEIDPACNCMELCHFYDTEAGYDGGNVKVSTDGGTSWQIAHPFRGYDDVLDSQTYPAECVWGEEVFSRRNASFQRDCFDLSDYEGESVYVGFFFGSDSSSNYPGWYLKWLKLGNNSTPVQRASWGAIKAIYR